MSSLIRRIQRQVSPSQKVHVVTDLDGEPKLDSKGRLQFDTNPPRKVFYMGRGSKLGVPAASPWPPRKKRAKPYKTLAERKAAREKMKAVRKARVAAVRPPKTRIRGFDGHYHGRPRGIAPLANLSRNHPDYGCTPDEHARRKAEREVI